MKRTTRRKVAISVSADVLAAADRLSRQTGESRSAVYERALRAYLAAQGRGAQIERYVAGYRRHAETPAQVAAALATALPALTVEPWDETG